MAVDNIQVIQATLAPIFLLMGSAVFTGLVQARLFRVSDRLHDHEAPPRLHDMRRLRVLRNAVILAVLAMALTVLTAMILLVPSAFPGHSVGAIPIGTLGLTLIVFTSALVCAMWDAFLAVGSAEAAAARSAPARAEDPVPLVRLRG